MKSAGVILLLILYAYPISGQNVKKIKISDLKTYIDNSTKPMIVSFWATWCKPCIEELSHFQEIRQSYKDKLDLVLVSMDFKKAYPDQLNKFVISKNLKGSLFWLDETDADYFCPVIDSSWSGAIPATLFVNNAVSYKKFLENELTATRLEVELNKMIGTTSSEKK